MVKEIELTKGKVAIVDNEDFDRMNLYKWCAVTAGGKWYAQRRLNKKQTIYMHQVISKPQKKQVVDHIDRDGLNNTRENLRNCSYSENRVNSLANSNPNVLSPTC